MHSPSNNQYSMNNMISQFNDMSTSSRGRGSYRGNNSGGGGNRGNYPVMRYPPRPYYGGDQNRGERRRMGPPMMGHSMRGGYRNEYVPMGPPHMMNPRGPYNSVNDWRSRSGYYNKGHNNHNYIPDADEFQYYPSQLSTHKTSSSVRYNKDWSALQPRDVKLENDLFKNLEINDINFDVWKDIPVEMSGSKLPEPVKSFKEMSFCEILKQNLDLCCIVQPTPIQMYSYAVVRGKRDLMACAQTGSGKTAAFLLPMLANMFENGPPEALKNGKGGKVTPLALILAPTRELASQIFEMTQRFCYRSCVRPYVVYGGSNIDRCIHNLSLGVEILIATPGRLIDLLNRGEISLELIQYLILDEADRMLDMGFEKDIRTIVSDYKMSGRGARQTLMFSATFPKSIQLLAKDFMEEYVFLTVGKVGSTNNYISQRVRYIRPENKIHELIKVVSEIKGERILVFVRTKRDTDKIQGILKKEGFNALSIHGDKSQRRREEALAAFRCGEVNILVATEVAARGLDIPNIGHVINFDMPDTTDTYVHRIGRTGRMGHAGKSTSFFCEADWHLANDLIDLLKKSNQDVPNFLAETKSGNNYNKTQKSTYSNDRFGGRDYRRGPQLSTLRYSANKMPYRNYPSNQPENHYYSQSPFNSVPYNNYFVPANNTGYANRYNSPAGYNTNYNFPDSNNSEKQQSDKSTSKSGFSGHLSPQQNAITPTGMMPMLPVAPGPQNPASPATNNNPQAYIQHFSQYISNDASLPSDDSANSAAFYGNSASGRAMYNQYTAGNTSSFMQEDAMTPMVRPLMISASQWQWRQDGPQ